jgi:hypothetical protein
MSAPNGVLTGDELLVAVTDAMVEFHHRYYDREPVTGKAALVGEQLLACVLGDVGGEVEQTMIDLQATTILQEARSPFQEAMQDKLIAAVERLSGCRVQAFISNSHAPDIEIELFMLNAPQRTGPEHRLPVQSSVRGYAWESGMSTERDGESQGSVPGYAYAWERPSAD